MHKYKEQVLVFSLLIGLGCTVLAQSSTAQQASQTIEQQREEIRAMANDTLKRLYKIQPSAEGAIKKAAGYAVFSNFGMKILLFGGGSGKGIAVTRNGATVTFMKMIEMQAGFGMGVKKFRLVWVFDQQSDLDNFINSGWEFGGQGTAAAKASGQGNAFAGAISVSPGVWLYQLTDDGLALELTVKGSKYFKDDKLN